MGKILKFIFRQYNIGQGWGAFSQTFAQITAFITLFNTLLLIPTAYVTWFSPWAHDRGWVISFTSFFLVILVVSVITLFVGYKLLVPSSFSFWSSQFWKHQNPIKRKLDRMEKNQDNQNKRLKVIEGILKRIEKQHSTN